MLLQINKGEKSFGATTLFDHIQFEIRDTEKIALIGRNGCGKTTLLKIIIKEEELTKGQLIVSNNVTIGYLSQAQLSSTENTVFEELDSVFSSLKDLKKELDDLTVRMQSDYSQKVLDQYAQLEHQFDELGGYNYQYELQTVFSKFGFTSEDLEKKINEFSGGERTRIAFVKLLLSKPDILLLDEPTNHLDLETIEWLEGYLKHYPKAVVLVSHDRMFLEDVCDVVYEIEHQTLTRFKGSYSAYQENKKLMAEKQLIAFNNQQKEIERIEEQIEKFRYKKNKAAFAQSKIKYLEHLDRVDPPKASAKNFHAHFVPKTKSGQKVLTLSEFTVGYDSPLLSLDLLIKQGDRVGIIGANGTGKSTFVKSIVGQIEPLKGEMLLGHNVEVGYFDQNLAQIDSNKTVLEELWDEYPELDRTTIRTTLGNFLFSGDDVFKSVSMLSGGEKVRLCLAKLMLKRANFLILDEPTNHLDIEGKEALEDALSDYQGTLLFVSHDRYFIKKLSTAIIEINEDGAKYYPLNYDDYLTKKHNPETEDKKEEVKEEKVKYVRNINYEKEIAKIEEKINVSEIELERLRSLRYEPEYYQDSRKMDELDEIIDEQHNLINDLMGKWEELNEILEGKNNG